jgi:hypothetical protein
VTAASNGTSGVSPGTFNTYTSGVKKRFDNHSSIYVPIATYPLNSGQVASFTTGAIVQQQYSSTVRKAAASTAGVITLAALTGDVSISSPVTNQFLKYVGADWINATATFYGYSNYSSTHASILAGKQPSGSYVTQSQTINGTAYGSGNITIRDAGYLNYSTEGHHGTGGGSGLPYTQSGGRAVTNPPLAFSSFSGAMGQNPMWNVAYMTATTGGAVPVPPNDGTTKYLREDATWGVPPGGSSYTLVTSFPSSDTGNPATAKAVSDALGGKQATLTNPLVAGTMVTGDYCTKNSASNTIDCNTAGAGGSVNITGTPSANQFTVWADASHIQGVNVLPGKVQTTTISGTMNVDLSTYNTFSYTASASTVLSWASLSAGQSWVMEINPSTYAVTLPSANWLDGSVAPTLTASRVNYIACNTPNGSTVYCAAGRSILQAATSSALGGVMPDGTSITNSGGAIGVAYGTSANTAAQGNDSRITGALPANGGTVQSIKETVVTGGTCSTSYAINPANGTIFTLTLSGACQLTYASPVAGTSFMVKLSQSSTTAPTFGSTLVFSTTPAWSSTSGKVDRFACVCETSSYCGCVAVAGFAN